ncbi:MAG: type II toxin-antitoxin system prevent-host-death family antitoxin [Chloroflexi bacterium]|jgi:prevent-host-death family protein|nr:type II toxin-antitoxin system prevent-host-death family antitoxin [Chloroflexota bacterium]
MSKVVTSTELRKKTREVIAWTRANGEAAIIETRGKPMAALLPYEEYQAYVKYKQARAASFARLRQVAAENAAFNELTEDEALALAEHARQDFYEALGSEE